MIRFDDWYFDLFESGNGVCLNQQEIAQEAWDYQQSKIDELQKQRDSFIKAYEIEMEKSIELQKRVDAVNGLIEDLNKCYQQDHRNKFEYWRGFADSAGILGKRLEQALKGDQ